jgi:hypothetical protein
MIHMHLLQSPVQKAYGLRRHGKPTVFWLDDFGLVESNVVYGHAIHVTEAEIGLMGRRNVSVTSHPSCNFYMRNGITPVVPSSGPAPTCSGRSNPMSRHGTAPGARTCSTNRSIGSIAEHRNFVASVSR